MVPYFILYTTPDPSSTRRGGYSGTLSALLRRSAPIFIGARW